MKLFSNWFKKKESWAELLLKKYQLNHSAFAGFVESESRADNRLIITTEGVPGRSQFIRIPKDLERFPEEAVVHFLAHEFVHVEQRQRPVWETRRPVREFEAYFKGIFPENALLPPCPPALLEHFRQAILKYFNQMTDAEKEAHREQFEMVFPNS